MECYKIFDCACQLAKHQDIIYKYCFHFNFMIITPELAELIGIHIGDGCLSNNGRYKEVALAGDLLEERIYYENHIVPLFNKIIAKNILGKKIKAKEYPSMGVYGFFIFNDAIFDYYKSLDVTVGSKVQTKIPKKFLSKKLIKHVLRGIFDTDGNLYFDKNRTAKNPINKIPIIKLSSTSNILIDQVFNELVKLGYHPRKKKPYKGKRDKNHNHILLIYRKRDVIRYIEKDMGFNNPKHQIKWEFFKKYGYYVPRMTTKDRQKLL